MEGKKHKIKLENKPSMLIFLVSLQAKTLNNTRMHHLHNSNNYNWAKTQNKGIRYVQKRDPVTLE